MYPGLCREPVPDTVPDTVPDLGLGPGPGLDLGLGLGPRRTGLSACRFQDLYLPDRFRLL
ncbi:MAG: hypothetical protein WC601_06500 [Desulfotomaculaceae bacterium]